MRAHRPTVAAVGLLAALASAPSGATEAVSASFTGDFSGLAAGLISPSGGFATWGSVTGTISWDTATNLITGLAANVNATGYGTLAFNLADPGAFIQSFTIVAGEVTVQMDEFFAPSVQPFTFSVIIDNAAIAAGQLPTSGDLATGTTVTLRADNGGDGFVSAATSAGSFLAANVPEAASFTLMAVGLLAMGWLHRPGR